MTHGSGATRTIGVEGISRVEGEGSLRVAVHDGTVTDVALEIFEPPRYFEALLVGRKFTEAPDITARICGICPVAYQMSACAAMEDACGVTVDDRVAALRRLLYCGEWIQSHALHIYLLHAPDFLGCEDAVELAERDRGAVERGLGLKRTGNLVMETVGGRAIHPVNVRVGGFYSAPDPGAVASLAEPLRRARDAALATVEWVSGFDIPDVSGDYRFVALRDTGHYPLERGRPSSTNGLDLSPAEFGELVVEEHVARSTALHARLGGREPYLTGPLARYALNADVLPPLAIEAAAAGGLGPVCSNPFRSIVVRAVELVFACDEALALVGAYAPPDPPAARVEPGRGPGIRMGTGVTEAPRGLLLHHYEIDEEGTIVRARIVPPTSQNQLTIEADLRRVVQNGLDLGDHELQWRCEQAVRNHDPCISCAAHFLDVSVVKYDRADAGGHGGRSRQCVPPRRRRRPPGRGPCRPGDGSRSGHRAPHRSARPARDLGRSRPCRRHRRSALRVTAGYRASRGARVPGGSGPRRVDHDQYPRNRPGRCAPPGPCRRARPRPGRGRRHRGRGFRSRDGTEPVGERCVALSRTPSRRVDQRGPDMCMSRLHRVVSEGEGEVDVEDLDGSVHRVSLLALDGPPPAVGDWLVVHSGYAIDRADATEAETVLAEARRAGRVGR